MYFTKTPVFIQNIFPDFIWRVEDVSKTLYLSFDDGPHPEITPWLLQLLKEYQAKATFFCLGEKVEDFPELYKRIITEGHTIGNHSYGHLSGWASENQKYFEDIDNASNCIDSVYFRPPFGRIKPSQSKVLLKKYKIVMWDVLSGDFDPSITKEQCYNNVISGARSGSIVVFHDSEKSRSKIKYVLPKILEYYTNRGYSFHNIEHSLAHSKYFSRSA